MMAVVLYKTQSVRLEYPLLTDQEKLVRLCLAMHSVQILYFPSVQHRPLVSQIDMALRREHR